MQVTMIALCLAAAALFGFAEIADYRRRNRRDADRVGFMPWRAIALIAATVAIFAAALAIKAALA